MEKEKKGNSQSSSSNVIKDFFMSFVLIFKYAYIAIKTIFSLILKPFMALFNKTSKEVDKVYQSTKQINSVVADEKNQSAAAKIWRLLNSDFGSSKKLSKKKLEKIQKQRALLQDELSKTDTKRSSVGKMYVYKATTKSGKIVTGRLYGFSKLDINAFLLNEGHEPFYIENNSMIDFLYGSSSFGSRKMKNKDLIFFLTQLSTYVKSGITLTDSMKILMNQSTKNKSRLGLYQSIVYELTMGSSFSEAINKQGDVFPPLLINMLKAAEATGDLEETLDDMVAYYTDIETTRKEMSSAMTYPIIVTVFALAVIGFILLYVIPKFSEIYNSMDVEISGITLALLNLSNFLKEYIWMILLILLLVVFALVFSYKRIKKFRKSTQNILMKMPIIGKVIIYNEMTIFAKTFSSLLKNNVNITESIDILSKITNNEIYKEIMIKTINNIAAGDRISEAFKNQWAIPEVAYYMIVTGESTGQLAEMMSKVAEHFQEQHKNIINSLKSLIEPIMIALLAVAVGIILVSVLIPMYDMYDQLTLG